eukprot:TRINITY_DN4210_c0_g1_i1.p1 TRINITY_DN4210_c0_g1~~TRINITY_DN4210_c0_g1_i1.p1  ORF type:complete len:358 (-),score=81.46 TRINITY_DN4210_c0_g1_i1:57-1130(-)
MSSSSSTPWVSFSFTIPDDKREEGVFTVVRHFVPEYRDLPDSSFTIKPLNGGITNILFLVSSSQVEPRANELPVIIRIYGDKTEDIINREAEMIVQQHVWEKGIGPKFYGVFDNGCVYAFLPGKVLDFPELADPSFISLVAPALAIWHQVDLDVDKNPILWKTIHNFISRAPPSFDNPEKHDKLESLNIPLLKKEAHTLESALARIHSPVVFCHNDLLAFNIIISDDGKSASFIDYEYAAYNFRGFDLGNHFNEFAGFGPDYKLYPNKETQTLFIRKYLEAFHNNSSNSSTSTHKITEEEVERVYVEANQYSLASHLYWGFWALFQSQNSPIDFDYLGYAKARFDRYFETKDKFMSV